MQGKRKSCPLTCVFYKYLSAARVLSYKKRHFGLMLNACISTRILFSVSHKSRTQQGRLQSHPAHCKGSPICPTDLYTDISYSFPACSIPAGSSRYRSTLSRNSTPDLTFSYSSFRTCSYLISPWSFN